MPGDRCGGKLVERGVGVGVGVVALKCWFGFSKWSVSVTSVWV